MPSVIWKGSTTQLSELSDSPFFEFGEKATCVRKYRGLYSLARSFAVPKGAIGTGSMAGYKVANCKVASERMGIGLLTITFEAYSVSSGESLPPDDFNIEPVEINPRVEKNPFFNGITDKQIDLAHSAFSAPNLETRIKVLNPLTGDKVALSLLDKLRHGEENFYLAGFTYTWTSAYWTAPSIDRGGRLEFPSGPLSGIMPTDMTYLRKADALGFTGVYYKLTRGWIGAPSVGGVDHWDRDLYK